MKPLLTIVLGILSILFTTCKKDEVDVVAWMKTLGGSQNDWAYSIQRTNDGGYIVAGTSSSGNGDVFGHHGVYDYWVVKLDANGNLQWQKCLGGSETDWAYSIQQTSDGGYIVAGASSSTNGDVSENHGILDFWIVKLDDSGNLQWQKCLGGSEDDRAYSVQQTNDGGYIVAGTSSSSNGDVIGHHGVYDYWVVKLDAIGNLQWQKCLGGSKNDWAYSIQQTNDGGYVIAGYSESNDGDVSGKHANADYWIIKLDDSGDLQWQKCLGGSGGEVAYSVQQTNDGGYIVAGTSVSINGDVIGNHGARDYWIVKLDDSGDLQWQKCLGGSGDDWGYAVQQTNDGGYVVLGFSGSNDGDVSENHGGLYDYWIIKLDNTGSLKWQKCLGGSGVEVAYSVQQTNDGGYIVAGTSASNNGDVSGNHGNDDYWVVKLPN